MQSVNQIEVIDTVRQLLVSGDDLDRCSACRTLGALAVSSSIPDLVAALQDEDIDVRVDAARALGSLDDSAAVEPLLQLLHNDPSGEMKTAVLEVLAGLGNRQVVPHLISLAGRRPDNMTFEAGDDAWDAWWDIQRIAVEALGQMGASEAVPVLIAILDDENQEGESIESEVFTALARIGGSGEAALIKRLANGAVRERRRAARALGKAASAAGLHALTDALKDGDDDVRAAVIEALVQRRAGRYAGVILAHIKDPAPQVRRAALHAISELAGSAEIDYDELIALAGDNDAQVRAAVLRLLGGVSAGVEPAGLWEAVRGRLADTSAEVAAMACQLAGRLNEPRKNTELLAVLADGSRDASVRSQAAIALGGGGEATQEVLDGLAHALGDKGKAVRLAALHALMTLVEADDNKSPASDKSGDKADAEQYPTPLELMMAALSGELSIEDDTASQETLGAGMEGESAHPAEPVTVAGELAGESAVASAPDLATVLRNYGDAVGDAIPPESERSAASTLESLAMDNVEAALIDEEAPQAMDDEAVIAQMPEELSEEISDYLAIMQKQRQTWARLTKPRELDIKTDVRALSARMLGGCARPEAVTALIKALQDAQPEVQKEAAESIARIARLAPHIKELGNAMGPLITHVNFAGRDLRLACIQALGALGRHDALPFLQECLENDDPVFRLPAVRAMVELVQRERGKTGRSSLANDKRISEVATTIMHSLDDGDMGVRKAAASGLAELGASVKQEPLRAEICARLVQAGIDGEGSLAGDMGRAIRAACPDLGAAMLTSKLGTLPTSRERGLAMEMLVEIYRPATA